MFVIFCMDLIYIKLICMMLLFFWSQFYFLYLDCCSYAMFFLSLLVDILLFISYLCKAVSLLVLSLLLCNTLYYVILIVLLPSHDVFYCVPRCRSVRLPRSERAASIGRYVCMCRACGTTVEARTMVLFSILIWC